MKTVLFLNHKEKSCGVYQYGYRTSEIITKSKKHNIKYAEIDNEEEYWYFINTFSPVAVIYNYYPSTMPWLNPGILHSNRDKFKQVAIFHEVPITLFDYYIYADPTMPESGYNFSVGRPLIDFETEYKDNDILTIGSFGFGFGNKGYWNLVRLVNQEFDSAIINLHISFATFGDKDGKSALSIADYCRNIDIKSSIQLNITHHFMSTEELLKFLAGNTLNAFLYDESYGRGPASTIDYALSVKRPIAITKSHQFRHIRDTKPSICIEDTNLKTIIENETKPLEKFYKIWSSENLIRDYENILDRICL